MIENLFFLYTIFGVFYLWIVAIGLLVARDGYGKTATKNWSRALLMLPLWPLVVVWGIGYLLGQVILMADLGGKK